MPELIVEWFYFILIFFFSFVCFVLLCFFFLFLLLLTCLLICDFNFVLLMSLFCFLFVFFFVFLFLFFPRMKCSFHFNVGRVRAQSSKYFLLIYCHFWYCPCLLLPVCVLAYMYVNQCVVMCFHASECNLIVNIWDPQTMRAYSSLSLSFLAIRKNN